MQPREKKLAIVVGSLAAILGGWFLYSGIDEAFSRRQGQIKTLSTQLKEKNARLELATKQRQQLKLLAQRSLPTDRQLARSLYENWLIKIADQAGLEDRDVQSQRATPTKDGFNKLSFTVNGKGTLESITKFLYEFYRAGHVQKVHRLSLKTADNSKLITMSLAIEALALDKADRTDRLTTVPGNQLAEHDLAKYKDTIVGRNIFAPYSPPPPPKIVENRPPRDPPKPPPKPPEFDPARFARLTSILAADGKIEAWVLVQTTGEKLILHEGDSFTVGSIKAQVLHIGIESMVYASNGENRLMMIGDSLTDATFETSNQPE